jgi:hypothetical protein
MQDAGLLGQGNIPNGAQFADYFRRLNDLVNYYQTRGLKLWLNEDITVPLTAGQASYTFKPAGSVSMTKPLRVLEAYYLYDNVNSRRTLTQISLRDYWQLGQAGTASANQGSVTQFVVEKQQTQLRITFWPCPDTVEAAGGDVHLLMQTQVTNAISLTETMNFPQEWRIALRWGLADEISTGQPQAIMDRCSQRAQMYKTALENWDVEDAPTTLTPDLTMTYQNNSFI